MEIKTGRGTFVRRRRAFLPDLPERGPTRRIIDDERKRLLHIEALVQFINGGEYVCLMLLRHPRLAHVLREVPYSRGDVVVDGIYRALLCAAYLKLEVRHSEGGGGMGGCRVGGWVGGEQLGGG